ncbi:MAG: AEC family transporter [Eubacterium sp.]|nr:AEC family transporter [Eubacterium sp.]
MNIAVIQQVAVMAILVAVGYACRKGGMLDDNSTKKLSALLLNIVIPIVILVSYQKPFDTDMLGGLLLSFALAGISIVSSVLLIPLIFRDKAKDGTVNERLAAVYSNCAFMGIPLIQGIFGSDGVFYLTAYITLFNAILFTHGAIVFSGEKFTLKKLGKALLHPSVIAIAAGLILFLLGISLPGVLLDTCQHIANLNTPLAMIVAGSTIATVRLRDTVKKPRLYAVCAIKLIAVPALLMALCYVCGFDRLISGVNVIAAACPTAAACTMFAIKYNKNPGYSSELFAATTILSCLTLPLVLTVFEAIIK